MNEFEEKIMEAVATVDRDRVQKVEMKRYKRRNGQDYICITIEINTETVDETKKRTTP